MYFLITGCMVQNCLQLTPFMVNEAWKYSFIWQQDNNSYIFTLYKMKGDVNTRLKVA